MRSAYGAKSVTDPRSELGLRTDRSYALQDGILTLRGRLAWAHDFDPDRASARPSRRCRGRVSLSTARAGQRLRADDRFRRDEVDQRLVGGGTFEGEFSNVTASYAGKGVVR